MAPRPGPRFRPDAYGYSLAASFREQGSPGAERVHIAGNGKGRIAMSTERKIDAKADEVKGKVKEGVGGATDDKGLETEGKTDQAKGKVKEAAEKVKDVFK
jgi:uncharacterized protein YjbJ (UPF0337 family)